MNTDPILLVEVIDTSLKPGSGLDRDGRLEFIANQSPAPVRIVSTPALPLIAAAVEEEQTRDDGMDEVAYLRLVETFGPSLLPWQNKGRLTLPEIHQWGDGWRNFVAQIVSSPWDEAHSDLTPLEAMRAALVEPLDLWKLFIHEFYDLDRLLEFHLDKRLPINGLELEQSSQRLFGDPDFARSCDNVAQTISGMMKFATFPPSLRWEGNTFSDTRTAWGLLGAVGVELYAKAKNHGLRYLCAECGLVTDRPQGKRTRIICEQNHGQKAHERLMNRKRQERKRRRLA
jgi:hypothetical protein